MPRCLSCGRRTALAHAPCGPAALAPSGGTATGGAATGAAPDVPGYLLERPLGAGGFGAVFAARRLADGRCVALKVARPDAGAREQLAREEAALEAIGPPAVPRVVASGELADGAPFLALELVEAPTLAAVLDAADGPLAADRLAPAALAVVDALAAVHARGWAHGDLKPENVLLRGEPPVARLVDLGLARRLGEPRAAGEGSEGFAGTAEYMAPELCDGHAPDARSDVYAAGALLFELAAGRPPFFGAPADVRRAHLELRPPRADACGRVVADVLQRCLAKAPAERFASAGELRDALAAAFAARAAPERAPSPPPPPAPRSVKRRMGVLYLSSPADPVVLQEAAARLGGAVAHAQGGRYALVFDGAAGENPVRVALRAARAAVGRCLAERGLVDLATVTARSRPGGADRYLCPAFADPATWPRGDDPPGVLATARAAEVLAGTALAPVVAREGLFACHAERGGAEEATVVRHAAAPLVGRDALVAALVDAARGALAGAPTLAAVVGEPGLGKSHLAATLAERLRALASAPEVIELRGAPGNEGGALGALLRAALELPDGFARPPDGGAAFLALALPAPTGGAWPAVALGLGWLAPDAAPLKAIGAAPGALVSVAVQAAAELLRRRAALRPVCLLLDDAHLAGGAALDAIEAAALAEGGARLFACALARPAFDALRPFWGERAAGRVHERLAPLSREAAAELCRRLLRPADVLPAQVVDRLVARTEGVPLLLLELVRGLRRDGLVRRHPQGGSHYLATDALDRIPDMPLVEWLADAELRAMPAPLAAHAQLVALLGPELDPAETEGVLAELARAGRGDGFPLDPAAGTRRLRTLGLLVERRGGRLGFRWPLLREALDRSAPEAQRLAIHEAAFRFHARPGSLPELARLERLARHAAAVGERGQARDALLHLAADRAARHAWLDAEMLFSGALSQMTAQPCPERLAALRGRGLMRCRIGRHVDAIADLAAAGGAARALGDAGALAESLLDEATALDWVSDYASAEARVAAADAIAQEPTPALRARLALGRGRALFRAARWDAASAALEEAVRLAGPREDEAYETLVAALLLLGGALPPLGRPREADEALERARRLASARGDLVHLGVVHLNRRNLSVSRGDLWEAVKDQLEAVRLARELGRVETEYYAEYNVGELFHLAGDPARAAPHVARAAAIEAAHPEAAPVPLALALRARMLAFSGDVARAREALAAFRAAVARAAALGWRGAEVGPNVAVLADMVDLATRGADDAAWDALVARSARGSIEEEPVEVLEMRGLSALRAGRPAAARAALERALELSRQTPGLLGARVAGALAALGGARPSA